MGSLTQLVAYGAQDICLTGNAQITFFKVAYNRHTNFSMDAISSIWNGSSSKPNKYKIILPGKKGHGFRISIVEGYSNVLWDTVNNKINLDLLEDVFENNMMLQIFDDLEDDLDLEDKL